MEEEVNKLKSISLNADSKIENMPCSCFREELDIWDDYKDCARFKFCPFCSRVLKRTINIQKNSIIGYAFFETD